MYYKLKRNNAVTSIIFFQLSHVTQTQWHIYRLFTVHCQSSQMQSYYLVRIMTFKKSLVIITSSTYENLLHSPIDSLVGFREGERKKEMEKEEERGGTLQHFLFYNFTTDNQWCRGVHPDESESKKYGLDSDSCIVKAWV